MAARSTSEILIFSFLLVRDGRRISMFKIKRIVALLMAVAMLGSCISISPCVYADMKSENDSAPLDLNIDLSGRELLVGTNDPAVFGVHGEVVSGYDGVYLVRFETEEATLEGYKYYSGKADFVDVNIEFGVSGEMMRETAGNEEDDNDDCDDGLAKLENLTEEGEFFDVPGGTIAVIDTGINADDLVGRVSLIDDGDGSDDHGHGTKMYEYIKEEYPEAEILSIKALDENGKGSTADIYAAIRYAMECGAGIINLSVSAYGGEESRLIREAVDEAADRGIIVVGAAGNNGRDARYYIPGNIESAVIAGSCDEKGKRRTLSNYGSTVDINVVSQSTSEAAARLSGIFAGAFMSGRGIELGSGKLFPADYVPNGTEETIVDSDHENHDVDGDNDSNGAGDANEGNDSNEVDEPQWFSVALKDRPTEGHYVVNEGTGTEAVPPFYHHYSFETEEGIPAVCIDNDYNGTDDDTLGDEELLYCYIPVNRTEVYAEKTGSNAEKMVYYLTYYLLTHTITEDGVTYQLFDSHYGHLTLSYWNRMYGGGAGSNTRLEENPKFDEELISGWIEEALSEENINACDQKEFHVYKLTYNGTTPDVQSFLTYELSELKKVKLKKTAKAGSFKAVADSSPNYSLAGAVYEVRKGSEQGEVVGRLITDADGNTSELSVSRGIYYVKETTASKGYRLDSTVYRVEITKDSDDLTVINSVEEPDSIMLKLNILKKDSEGVRVDGADISGAEFTVSYYKGENGKPYYNSIDQLSGVSPDKVWKYKTDSQGRIDLAAGSATGDSFFLENGKRIIPFGTILIEETKTPDDYSVNNAEYIFTDNGGEKRVLSGRKLLIRYTPDGISAAGYNISTDSSLTVLNQVKRGDMSIRKTDRTDGRGMRGVHFTIKNVLSGEQIEVVTDENGCWSSASSYALHTKETNSKKAQCGTWIFGTSSKKAEEIDNDLGAFPLGTYEIREIVPEGYYDGDVTPVRVEIKGSDDGRITEIACANDRLLSISTHASDSVTLSGAALAAGGSVLVDKVDYEGTVNGQQYTVFTKLIEKNSGEELASASRSFVATGSSGSLEISVNCDLSLLGGKDVVFYEYIFKGVVDDMNGKVIGSHEDINDEGQTIHIPDAATTARSGNGLKEELAGKNAVIIDDFKYRNLPVGQYKVVGRLVYADTPSNQADETGGSEIGVSEDASVVPVCDDDGNEIVCEKVFTTTEMNGSEELSFSFPAESLEGRTVVVFERLYDMNGHLLIIHEDIEDTDQMISFPKLRTHASGNMAGYGETSDERINAAASGEDCVITDFVEYSNLIPGNNYRIEGKLKYGNGMPVLDLEGNEIIAEREFIPEDKDGEAEVIFEFDSSFLAGETVYISEELYNGDFLTGIHDDREDTEQIIHFPSIRTHARDDYSGIKTGEWRETVTLTDLVSYENLVTDFEYRIKGRLMDRQTGEPYRDINGEEVIAYSEIFSPDEPAGNIEVHFLFKTDLYEKTEDDETTESVEGTVERVLKDSDIKGVALVVFEELLVVNGSEEGVIAKHEDIDDEGQTVFYPRTKEIEKITERLTEKEKEKITERLIEKQIEKPDCYCKYLCYLEIMGKLNLEILTDGDQAVEKLPMLAETNEKKEETTIEKEGKQIKTDINPKTGDNMPVLLLIIILIASASGMIVLRRMKKGRRD
ncbi:MAG TPA: hypothetical protein DEO87_05860 [Lachnospiraceae bacterium]|nr:hypothetical protein [Lachnospiraceae bacterium]